MKIIKNLMKVEKDAGGDYYIHIPKKAAEGILNSGVHQESFKYDWLEADVRWEKYEVDETLGLTCSNDCRVAKARGQLTFDRGEDEVFPQDINVRIFPSRLLALTEGQEKFLTTRYDGEQKVWIFLSE